MKFFLTPALRLNAVKGNLNMRGYILIAALVFLPLSASAKSASGLGTIPIIAVVLGVAYIVTLLTIGGPIALINKLFGRNANHEIGGKVFAISFLLGPILSFPLMSLFDKSDAGICLLLGWGASIFVLNSYFSRNSE